MTQLEHRRTPIWQIMLFWLYVMIPLVWGVIQTLKKAMTLFG